MSYEQLINLLKNTPASRVEKAEVMYSAPPQYHVRGAAINLILKGQGKEPMSLDDLVVMLFEEVEYVWPKLGYPPLVTPFSQYVKNVALMNVMQLVKGEERWTMIDNHTWDMILGKSGLFPDAMGNDKIDKANSIVEELTGEDIRVV